MNHVSEVEVRLGGIEALKQESFDFIFANINRNILLADMHAYVACMKRGSRIFMSGFTWKIFLLFGRRPNTSDCVSSVTPRKTDG